MNINIIAEMREIGTKADLNLMRKQGSIPAVIYSSGEPAINISVNKHDFLKQYRKTIGELVFFNMKVQGKEYQTIIKEKQIDPVTREIIHLDFLKVAKDKKIVINVPFKFTGTPVGVKNGGSLDIILREVQVNCLPNKLPEDIEIDVTNLEVGQSIHVGDLPLGDFEVMVTDDVTIAVVHPPKQVLEAGEEVSEESAEESENDGNN